MYLCVCKSVSDVQMRQAVEQGARTVADLSIRLGVGFECGRCVDGLRDWLDACLTVPTPTIVDDAPQPVTADAVPSSPAVAPAAPAQAAWFMIDP